MTALDAVFLGLGSGPSDLRKVPLAAPAPVVQRFSVDVIVGFGEAARNDQAVLQRMR